MSSEDHREEGAEEPVEASLDSNQEADQENGIDATPDTTPDTTSDAAHTQSEQAEESANTQADQAAAASGLNALNKAVLIALLLLGAIWLFQMLSGDSDESAVETSGAAVTPVSVAPESESANVAVLNRDEDTDVVTVGGIERRGEGRHFFTTIKVPAGAESLYLSGSGASPLEDGSWGDMEQQVTDTFEGFKQTLESQGWSMGDIVQVRAFALSDEFGYLDFDGFNRGYRKFFGTEENPLKPVRTFVEIQDLVVPGWLVEIEIRAARVN
jgi:enamine deaminase RidA (YjgF/YER057c/UK114 family)